jgi:hypothetical protein
MEQVLAGKRKFIVDSRNGRRHLLMLEDGVELPPSLTPLMTQPNRPPREEE